jgi:hypothetical protein
MQGMLGWEQAEGGHWHNSARFNPLNTTLPMPGAGNTGTQGNIKSYRSPRQGVRATVRTLRNGNYGAIIQALKAGDPSRVAAAIDSSPWGTHGSLISSTISSAPRHAGGGGPVVSGGNPAGGATGGSQNGSAPALGGAESNPMAQALLARLSQPKQLPQSAGLQAPSFSASVKLPDAFKGVANSGGGGTQKQSVSQLLAASRAVADISGAPQAQLPGQKGKPGRGGTAPGGRVKGDVFRGSPLPGVKPHSSTHDTAGLPGYPAFDYMAPAGSVVVAPVNGKVIKLSGYNPKLGAVQGAGGPLGCCASRTSQVAKAARQPAAPRTA